MNHELFMNRCLQLAANALGSTYPNPLVGSVIVDPNGKILGEGYHLKSGGPHAEVHAIANAERKGYTTADFARATLYVNLEPCSHHGKTPPCAALIINKGFKKVVIGTLDPHDKVAGKGVALLKEAGIEATVGILEKECNELNKRFFTYHKHKRPYIMLKWGQTADGFIAPLFKDETQPVWITNTNSRQLVHQMRAQEHSIVVGPQTVLDDNPRLTVRDWYGSNPIRIVLDQRGDLPDDRAVFDNTAVTQLLKRGTSNIETILEDLYFLNIQSVIIEGGARTLQQFIKQDCWDEIHLFKATTVYFREGIAAPDLPKNARLLYRKAIKNDVLKVFYKS